MIAWRTALAPSPAITDAANIPSGIVMFPLDGSFGSRGIVTSSFRLIERSLEFNAFHRGRTVEAHIAQMLTKGDIPNSAVGKACRTNGDPEFPKPFHER